MTLGVVQESSTLGLGEGLVVKSTHCSCKGPQFKSQHHTTSSFRGSDASDLLEHSCSCICESTHVHIIKDHIILKKNI